MPLTLKSTLPRPQDLQGPSATFNTTNLKISCLIENTIRPGLSK